MPPLTPRQQQAMARQQQILEASMRLFSQNGIAGTSTKQIAQEVGVAEGLIFHYFPTKRDLLKAILVSRNPFFSEAKDVLDNAEKLPLPVMLEKLSAGWLATLRNESEFMSILFTEAQINAEVHQMMQRQLREGIKRLAIALEIKSGLGELRAGLAVQTLAHMFLSANLMFFMLNRHLDAQEWQTRSENFVKDLITNWTTFTVSTRKDEGESI